MVIDYGNEWWKLLLFFLNGWYRVKKKWRYKLKNGIVIGYILFFYIYIVDI